MDLDSYLEELIQEVRGLFGVKTPPVRRRQLGPTSLREKFINYPRGYNAPIHGAWRSSGGFTYTPNATHPTGHMGVDMRVAGGSPVYPLTFGIVSNVGTDPKGGNVVNIQHPNGVSTYYAHLSTVRVEKGDKVDANTVIGAVGSSGNASHTFPHLHFQVWENGQIQDPARYFSVPQYSNLTPEERQQGGWLSERAKQEAQAFNMQEYLVNNRKRRLAFSERVEKLYSFSYIYDRLTKKL